MSHFAEGAIGAVVGIATYEVVLLFVKRWMERKRP